jgi:single-strand DNA-binding protein
MNHATIAGHLGSDPETRFTSGGQKVTSFRVGCRSRKDETIWWRVTVWGEQYDKMFPYLKKGSPVVVQGEINKPEIYTDKEGKPQISMGINATHLGFSPFGKGKDDEKRTDNSGSYGNDDRRSRTNSPSHEEALADEEIPF